jgi:hypothetical protein
VAWQPANTENFTTPIPAELVEVSQVALIVAVPENVELAVKVVNVPVFGLTEPALLGSTVQVGVLGGKSVLPVGEAVNCRVPSQPVALLGEMVGVEQTLTWLPLAHRMVGKTQRRIEKKVLLM